MPRKKRKKSTTAKNPKNDKKQEERDDPSSQPTEGEADGSVAPDDSQNGAKSIAVEPEPEPADDDAESEAGDGYEVGDILTGDPESLWDDDDSNGDDDNPDDSDSDHSHSDDDGDDTGLAGESLAESQLAADLEYAQARFSRLLAVLVGFGGDEPEGDIPDTHLMPELLTKAREVTVGVADGSLKPGSDAHHRAVESVRRAGKQFLQRVREIADQPNLPAPTWLSRQGGQ